MSLIQQNVNKLVDIFKKLIYNRVKQGCSARKRNLPCQIIILVKKLKNVTNPEKCRTKFLEMLQIVTSKSRSY